MNRYKENYKIPNAVDISLFGLLRHSSMTNDQRATFLQDQGIIAVGGSQTYKSSDTSSPYAWKSFWKYADISIIINGISKIVIFEGNKEKIKEAKKK